MLSWKKIYAKTEANTPKSLVGCLLAYALLLVISIAALYFLGAALRLGGGT